MDPLVHAKIKNRYVVEEGPLGATGRADVGGWSDVYLARDAAMYDRKVVLKFPKRELLDGRDGKRFRARFEREIRALVTGGANCPGVVPIQDVGEHGGRPFLVLEYVAGGSLEARISRVITEPGGSRRRYAVLQAPSEVARWLPGIAATLDTVHARGIIHRDVKPANVLISTDGHPYLSDFGIARVLDAGGAGTGGLTEAAQRNSLYTAGYESPEFIAGLRADESFDRYSLAVTVFRALTGRLPHWPTDAGVENRYRALADRRGKEEAEDVSTLSPQVSPEVAAVVARALARRPADRYPTCRTFSDAFAAALAGVPTERPAESVVPDVTEGPERAATPVEGPPDAESVNPPHRTPRRRWRTAAVAALSLLAVAAAVGWGTGLFAGTRGPGSGGVGEPQPVAATPPPTPPPTLPPPTVPPPTAPLPERDTTSPTLVVEPAGPDVEANERGEVVFTGRASDGGGALTVRMNGTEVAVVDGAFTATVRQVAEGGAEPVEFVARDVAGNETRVARRAKGRAKPPAWRAALERAKAAGRPATAGAAPDWEAATTAYEEAVGLDVPTSEVPKWLESGVGAWKSPATVTVVSPVGEALKTTGSSVEVRARLESARADDELWIGGERVKAGPGEGAQNVSLPMGSTAIEVEVRDVHGRVRATATVRVERSAPPIPRKPAWAKTSTEQDVYAAKVGIPVWAETDLGGGESLKFVLIPPGTFTMGSPDDEEGRGMDEQSHEVELTRGFYVSIHEVTNGQYRRFKPDHASGSRFDGAQQPVVEVSHDDAVSYATWLSGRGGGEYRLPTESEWEYACRAGTRTPFWFGGTITPAQANFDQFKTPNSSPDGESRLTTQIVKSFAPNGWGLHDTHGNVEEWCGDWYGPYPTTRGSDVGGLPEEAAPRVRTVTRTSQRWTPVDAKARVLRGGSWASAAIRVRSASRETARAESRDVWIGFRVVLDASRK